MCTHAQLQSTEKGSFWGGVKQYLSPVFKKKKRVIFTSNSTLPGSYFQTKFCLGNYIWCPKPCKIPGYRCFCFVLAGFGWHSIVDAQLQLAYLVLTFTSFISYLHAPFAWLPFPLHPTFILPLPAVCTGGNSISPLVHNRLSACNSTPTSTWAWSLLQLGRCRLDTSGFAARETDRGNG